MKGANTMFKKIRVTAAVMKRMYQLAKKGYSEEESTVIAQKIADSLLTSYDKIDLKDMNTILDKEFAEYL